MRLFIKNVRCHFEVGTGNEIWRDNYAEMPSPM
jgi:hypothetical protein